MRRGHAAIVLVIWWWWMESMTPMLPSGLGGCGNQQPDCAMYWGPLEELDGTPLEEPELEVSGPYITEDTCEGELGNRPPPGCVPIDLPVFVQREQP